MISLQLLGWFVLALHAFAVHECFVMSNHNLCNYLVNINCQPFSGATLCATNQITYSSECEFSKAMCAQGDIAVSHYGPCDSQRVEQELVLNITCTDILAMNCNAFPKKHKMCASNAMTYENECVFEKARCQHHELYLKHYGSCTIN
ncbi:agrin-like [Mya arenaria]|uniref:agrin-like n=1 Tax=Mya arenaria TaxID=6604 RepID=UPI0022DEEC0A|nr:agrin-like [Mya arenaria]